MIEKLIEIPGTELSLGDYLSDFDQHFAALHGADVWKLERRQVFHEPDNPSWMRYRAGKHHEALRMLEENRADHRAMYGELARRGTRVRRLRVVVSPVTSYLRWELHSLLVRAQCGEDVRVIGSGALVELEGARELPEVVILGATRTYRILYDERGVLLGGVLHTDPELTAWCRDQIAALHADAEPLISYFHREIA